MEEFILKSSTEIKHKMRSNNIIFTYRNHDHIIIKLNFPQGNVISTEKMFNKSIVSNIKFSLH